MKKSLVFCEICHIELTKKDNTRIFLTSRKICIKCHKAFFLGVKEGQELILKELKKFIELWK
jgi:hypothetical protein